MLEDIALMRAMPNMIVVVPCDSVEARKATVAASENGKPTYLRFGREKTPVMTGGETPFEIGKAYSMWESGNPQVAIVGCGALLYEALLAARKLIETEIEIEVINCHTISPIDERTIISAARRCGAIVTVEEHQINGGLGSAVAEVLSRNWPVPIEYVGMPNSFGESGKPDELLEKYKMKAKDIIKAVKMAVKRKNKE
ncbi:MAG: transketolase, partial [Microgenomates group bacterium Gr01-1014_5]